MSDLGLDDKTNKHMFQVIKPGVSQKDTLTNASRQSTAFGTTTTVVRLVFDQDAYVKFGVNPTALTDGTSMFVPASTPEYFAVVPGQKVAYIEKSADGTAWITEGA